uniref:Uncharacterized protein n=1 Tax=Siphoviridae sp. ctE6L85 TaxID=2826202 RepID=A0A8S5QR91_9CAUD|nr:MAG TPA: hypothetical protein [Siphoviridae sp. ctE6L85]
MSPRPPANTLPVLFLRFVDCSDKLPPHWGDGALCVLRNTSCCNHTPGRSNRTEVTRSGYCRAFRFLG